MNHNPYFRYVPGSRYAVLMIHGIAGSPSQFRDLLPLIPEDWSVYNILLDGHGGKVTDFSRSCMDDWKMQVDVQLHILFARHQQVLVVGHSMGALFAIQAAIRAPRRIPAIFLLQAPMAIHLPAATCVSSVQAALGYAKPGTKAESMRNGTAMTLTPRLWQYVGWIPRFMELSREIKATRKLLPRLQVPCKSFQSARDELVSPQACTYLENHPFIQNMVLPTSGHYSYSPKDTRLLQEEFKKLIETL